MALGLKEQNDALPDCQKSVTICPLVWTQYQHWKDRETDGWTELVKQCRTLHALHGDA